MELPEGESVSMESVEDGGGRIGSKGNPFEATLLWETIVSHLESSMKCGRHTQALRSFANCFYGSAAVDCLLPYLCTLLNKQVKREQVQTLCHKFIITGVIEDVRCKDSSNGGGGGGGGGGGSKEALFRESRLYRLTRNHFWSISSINSSNQDSLEERELTRAKSAEDISTEKEEGSCCYRDDLKGYASDSTISCSNRRRHSVHVTKKKRGSSKKKQGTSTSDLVLKKEAGFFQSIGTRMLLSAGWAKASSMFKGSDNAISSGPGESNESLAPPETKQRRKMAASRRHLKDVERRTSKEEREINSGLFTTSCRNGSSEKKSAPEASSDFPISCRGGSFEKKKSEASGAFPINCRSGSWEKKRTDTILAPKKRWSTEKARDESRHKPPPAYAHARHKEGRIPEINISEVQDMWYEIPPEDHYGRGQRSPKKEHLNKARFDYGAAPDLQVSDCYTRRSPKKEHLNKARFDYGAAPDLQVSDCYTKRRGSADKARGDYWNKCMPSWNAAPRGSCDANGLVLTRKSIDATLTHGAALHPPPGKLSLHSKRRKQSKEERHARLKDKATDLHTLSRHKPSSGSLKKESRKCGSSPRHDKPGKRKHLHRSHSFSSVEDFMAGPSDHHHHPTQSQPRHAHLPLVQDSGGDKWIAYGYV